MCGRKKVQYAKGLLCGEPVRRRRESERGRRNVKRAFFWQTSVISCDLRCQKKKKTSGSKWRSIDSFTITTVSASNNKKGGGGVLFSALVRTLRCVVRCRGAYLFFNSDTALLHCFSLFDAHRQNRHRSTLFAFFFKSLRHSVFRDSTNQLQQHCRAKRCRAF